MKLPPWVHAASHAALGFLLMAAGFSRLADGLAPYLLAAGSAAVAAGVAELFRDEGFVLTPEAEAALLAEARKVAGSFSDLISHYVPPAAQDAILQAEMGSGTHGNGPPSPPGG